MIKHGASFAEFSRRNFLGGATALSLFSLPGCEQKSVQQTASERPIGIQLYTVRAEMERDMPGTLKKIADIGYNEVEFHNYFGMPPAAVKKLIVDLGMTSPSMHLNAREVREDPEPLLEAVKEVGHDFATVAWLHPDDRQTMDQYKAWADTFNSLGERCRDMGLRFCYHNHDFEFQSIDGQKPFDVLLERTQSDLVEFELDFYWAEKSGNDVVSVLAKAPDRFPLCHIKDMDSNGAMADVGAGVIDFRAILANRAVSNFEHFFVERDDATAPLETAEKSHAAFASILETLP